MLTAIATRRGIPVAILVQKIKTKYAQFRLDVGDLLGQQQKEIDDLTA